MGKNPAFQFYPSDWTRDLDDYPLEIEGAWIRICCRLWWSEEKGVATKTLREWGNILRTHPNKTGVILKTLLKKKICDGEYLDNQNITIISRRMVSDWRISKIRQEVGKKGGNPNLIRIDPVLDNQTDNQIPTPSSSSSSSSLLPISNIRAPLAHEPQQVKKIKAPAIIFSEGRFRDIPTHLLAKWKEVAPGVNINEEIKKAELWVLSNPDKGRSLWGKFLSNWMVRAQENYIKYGGGNGKGIRTNRSDPGDKTLQSKQDAELAAIFARRDAEKASAANRSGGNSAEDDAPDFGGGRT